MRAQVEVAAECPECHARGTWIELYDPSVAASARGVAATAHCRLCEAVREGRVTGCTVRAPAVASGRCPCCAHVLTDAELGVHKCAACGASATLVSVRAGAALGDATVLEERLRAVLREEGDADLGELLARCFGGADIASLARLFAAGEAVDTALGGSLDVFGGAALRRAEPSRPPSDRPSLRVLPDDGRAMLRALVSVLMADGQRDPREAPVIDAFLGAEGLAPLEPDELRVWRPAEIAAKVPGGRRDELVTLMAQLAYADGVADPSEVRVVRAFADAWDIPQSSVDAALERFSGKRRSRRQRLLDRLRTFFLAE